MTRPTTAAPPLRRTGRSPLLATFGVFVVVFVVYLASPVREITDSYWSVYTSASLVRHHDANLDEYPTALRKAGTFQVTRLHGHPYYSVPIATSLLSAPIVAVALAVDGGHLQRELDAGAKPGLDPVIAAMWSALAAAVVFSFSRRVLRRTAPALLAAAVFAFGTVAWSTVSRSLWMHGPSMLCLAGVVWLMLAVQDRATDRPEGGPENRRARRDLMPFTLGALVALAFWVRPTNAIVVVAVSVWMLVVHRRRLVGYLVGGAAVGLVFLALDHLLYGVWLSPYSDAGRLKLSSTFPQALAGNLVSPARGLLVFSPVLALGVVGIVMRRRAGTLGSIDLTLGAAVVAQWIVVSLFPHWWGGWSYGSRFMSDVLPFLVWFLLPVVDRVVTAPRKADGRLAALTLVFVALMTLSVLINFRGAYAESTFAWNFKPANVDTKPSRLWDWGDPQFLR